MQAVGNRRYLSGMRTVYGGGTDLPTKKRPLTDSVSCLDRNNNHLEFDKSVWRTPGDQRPALPASLSNRSSSFRLVVGSICLCTTISFQLRIECMFQRPSLRSGFR